MRRTALILIALLMGLFLAAPAFAQGRDPFEPQPGSGQESPSGGSEGGERDPFDPQPGEGEDPSVDPDDDPNDPTVDPTNDPAPNDPDDEQPSPDDGDDETGALANTGVDVTTWGGIAYVLIAVGCGALVVGGLYAPRAARRRR